MELVINGRRHSLAVDPQRTLLFVLRNELDLAGTKYGCGEGQCGACTVLIDEVPVRSCQTSVAAATGHQVTTIEGIARGGELHPLQQAFLDCDAMQCGYCTPGMIVAGVALLKRNSSPSVAEIKSALQGHICRCGTYSRIVSAVGKAARASSRVGNGRRGEARV